MSTTPASPTPLEPTASRRDFLKTSAAAGTLAAVAGQFAHGAHSGGDTLRVGLIGCGGRGTGAAVNALNADKNVKLVAMGDAFADRLQGSLETLRRECPDKVAVTPERSFVGFDAYKQVLATDVDVVILTTPPGFRPAHLKAAVDAGKHVFCEKPMAVDAPGVRSVMASAEEAKKKGLCLRSGFCFRFDIPMRETVARIHDGAIGDVVALHVSYNTGTIWHHDRQPGWTDMEWQMRNWYYFTWLSGDHIVEQHCHNLDKANWVLKDVTPVAATGVGGRSQRTDPKFGHIFDHHSVVFEYPNGVKVFSVCRQMANCTQDVSDHIMGAKGSAWLLPKCRIDGATKWRHKGDAPNMYQVEHNELFAAIRAGTPVNDGQFMAQSTLTAIMGRMATYTGQRVTWQQALNSKEDLMPAKLDWQASLATPAAAVPGVTRLV